MGKKPESVEDGLRERLAQAAALGKLDRMRDLITQGAPVKGHGAAGGSTPWSGYTPLMVACYCGEVMAVQLLLDEGADADECGAQGDYPLTVASGRARLACVQALLAAGAKPDAADRQNRSALRLACEGGHPDIARHLLAAGSNPCASDSLGNTPAMAAVAAGSRACLELLVLRGVSFDTAGPGKTSLLEFALSAPQWTEVAEWLKAMELSHREQAALAAESSGEAAGAADAGGGRL